MSGTVVTNFEMVMAFSAATGGFGEEDDSAALRMTLLREEAAEVFAELESPLLDRVALAKELADLIYVAYGTANVYGIDMDRVFAEVHRSNMSKLVDGKPVLRADGKVLKGPDYRPPDLSFVVMPRRRPAARR